MLKRLKFWEVRDNSGCGSVSMTTNRIAPESNRSDSEFQANKRRRKSRNLVRNIFLKKSPKNLRSRLTSPGSEEVSFPPSKKLVCCPNEVDKICRQSTNPDSTNIASSSSSTNTLDLTDDQKLHWVSADEAVLVRDCHSKGCWLESRSGVFNEEEQTGILKSHCPRCCDLRTGKENQLLRKTVKFEGIPRKEEISTDRQTMTSCLEPLNVEVERKNFWRNPLESCSIGKFRRNKNKNKNNNNNSYNSDSKNNYNNLASNKALLNAVRTCHFNEKDLSTFPVGRCAGRTFKGDDLCLELQMSLNINVNKPRKEIKRSCHSGELHKGLTQMDNNTTRKGLAAIEESSKDESRMRSMPTGLEHGGFNQQVTAERLCVNCQKKVALKSDEFSPTTALKTTTSNNTSSFGCYKTLPTKNVNFSFPVFYENQTTVDDSVVGKTLEKLEESQTLIAEGRRFDIKPLKPSLSESAHLNDSKIKDFVSRIDNVLYHSAIDNVLYHSSIEGGKSSLEIVGKEESNARNEGSLKECLISDTAHAQCKCLHFVAYDNKLYQAASKEDDSPPIQPGPDNSLKCICHLETRKYSTCGRTQLRARSISSPPVTTHGLMTSCLKKKEAANCQLQSSLIETNHQSIGCGNISL